MTNLTNDRPDHHRLSPRRVNLFAVIGLCLLLLTPMLFYGPVWLYIFGR
jgi:hypothetical protein